MQVLQNEIRQKIREYISEIEINIKIAMENGQIQKDHSEFIAFEFFGSLCSSAIYESVHPEKVNLEDIIDSTIKFTLNGLGINIGNMDILWE